MVKAKEICGYMVVQKSRNSFPSFTLLFPSNRLTSDVAEGGKERDRR